MNPRTTGRLTTADYPSTTGLVMPLPAVSGLVCRYRSTPGDAPPPLVESFPVTGHDAEQIRAAYLASGRPVRQCVDDPDGALFAAVLVDATGSWRSFGFDTGDCDALVGPDLDRGSAGYWLVERVRYAVPAHLAQPAAPELEAAE